MLQCYSVAVPKQLLPKSQKTNSISIYINIYKYRSIFRYGGKHFENCNTATLQQRVQSRSLLQLCRAPKASTKSRLQNKCVSEFSHKKNFLKKNGKTFVNRNENVVTLQTEIETYPDPSQGRAPPPSPPQGGVVTLTCARVGSL